MGNSRTYFRSSTHAASVCGWAVVLLWSGISRLSIVRSQTTETAPAYQPPPYRVCTIDVPPMASCQVNNTDPSSFSGLSIDLFRDVASQIGWIETAEPTETTEGVANDTTSAPTYFFRCMGVETGTALKEHLVPEDGDCDIFVAWTTISEDRTRLGVEWAIPYYSGSVAILTQSTPTMEQGWAFFNPFTWDLWVAMGVTAIVLPIIIYGLEILVIRRRIGAREAASGYYESLWRTLWVLIQGETFGVSMIPARLVIATFAFFALILSSSYTANLAAFLTTQSYGGVRNIFDLRGSAVSTVEVYRDALVERYRLQPSIADISNLDAVRMEAEKILDGDLSAVVIDTVVAGYIVAEASGQGCPWRLLPDTILPFPYGIAFSPARVDRAIQQEFNAAILFIQETDMIADYEEKYLLTDSPCLSDATTSDTTSIGFMQVYGLWVMLGASVGLACVYVIAYRIWQRRQPLGWGEPGPEPEKAAGGPDSRKFARGDSREMMVSDLQRVETHLDSFS